MEFLLHTGPMRKTLFAIVIIAFSVSSSNAYSATQFSKISLSCLGKDKLAGACLPKNRHKYPLSVESNFMLACESNAKQGLPHGYQSYCGCTLVGVESLYTLTEFSNLETAISNGASTPQTIRNVAAKCLP
jgi:hypothetical protein